MKKIRLIWILITVGITSICVYQTFRKENIYIDFNENCGYQYQFIDSTDIFITNKVLINQSEESTYVWWEMDIDPATITKTSFSTYRKLVINSPFFIINNYNGLKDSHEKLKKYRYFIIRWEDKTPYILRVREIHYVIE